MVRMLEPNSVEKSRARTGYYETFDDMPRIVRNWAKENGFIETKQGVMAPFISVGGGAEMDKAVRESLRRN